MSIKKILLAFILAVATVAVLCGVFVFFFPQSVAVLSVKMLYPESKVPQAYLVPNERTIGVVVNPLTKRVALDECGTSFAIPRNKVTKKTVASKTDPGNCGIDFTFDNSPGDCCL